MDHLESDLHPSHLIERIRLLEATLAQVQYIGRLGHWTLDLETNHLEWSEFVYELLEIDPTRFAATYEAFLEAIHPDDRQFVDQAYRQSVACRRPYEVSHRLLMKDGRIKWVRETGRSEYSPSGQPLRSIGVVQDITEQKLMELALQASEERFRTTFEHLPLPYLSLSASAEILDLNDDLCRLLGSPPGELRGRSFDGFIPAQARAPFMQMYAEFLSRGWVETDLQLSVADGTFRTILLVGSTQEAGGVLKTHCILLDVTERHQLQARLEMHNASLAALHRSALAFLSLQELDPMLQSLVDHASGLFNAPHCSILTWDGNQLVERACTSLTDQIIGHHDIFPQEKTISWQAVQTRQPQVYARYADFQHADPQYTGSLFAFAALPILSGERCLGVLDLARSTPGSPFSPEEIQVARLFAQVAALALENSDLHQQLREQAVRDPLTGLYNRRYLFEALSQWVPRADREGGSISFVMLDIDHFKMINDRFGHAAGDYLLVSLAQALKKLMRAGDLVCRYGGDEHLIAMYNTSPGAALVRAEEICRTIRALPLNIGQRAVHLTASIGVATYPNHAASVDRVISLADKALYHSKNHGRNQVSLAAPTLEA